MKRSPFLIQEEDPPINLTPLIDVVFVILMAFMVSIPFIRIESLSLCPASRKADQTLSQDHKPDILIRVTSDNSISINEEPVDLSQLKQKLTSLKQQYPQSIPLLLQDELASFGAYHSIKTHLENAGFQDLQIALKHS